MGDSKGALPGKDARLIDVTRPVVTRNGEAAEFFCRDMHRIYPLSFKIDGKIRSFSLWGEFRCGSDSPHDLFNVESCECGIYVQLELFPELCK